MTFPKKDIHSVVAGETIPWKHQSYTVSMAPEPLHPFADFELTGEAQRNLKLGEWGISARGHLIQAVSRNGGDVGAIPLRRKPIELPRPTGALLSERFHYDVTKAPFPTNGHGFIFYRDPGDQGERGIPKAPLFLQYSTAKGRFYNIVTGKPYRARPKKGYWFYV